MKETIRKTTCGSSSKKLNTMGETGEKRSTEKSKKKQKIWNRKYR